MQKEWWKEAVVYQIYPKSFQDSDGDGVGDIRGITSRLDYLKELGINVIWICPVYQSPMDDGGYDISDFYTVDPMFGSNQDLDELLAEAGKVGIRIIMDLVVNHTSDEHEWFQKALKDPRSPHRKYYIFENGLNGQPPNNWRSYFGGSAWEAVPGEEGLYYLHAFSRKQPDLNWENPQLREEIYTMINYWLDKGIAGFRVDAILNIKKRMVYGLLEPDGEDGLVYIGHWIMNQPGVKDRLKELNEQTFKNYQAFTVAEAAVPNQHLKDYIGKDGFFSMVFDFSYTDIDVNETGEWFKPSGWTWDDMRDKIFLNQCLTQKAGWGALYLENHDQPRSVNKYIPAEQISNPSKKMLGTLFMLLKGTPFIYQGQELGMTNAVWDSIEEFDDIATHDQYQRALLSGLDEKDAFDRVKDRSRDNSRTPMQWSDQEQAGFTSKEAAWLKVNSNFKDLNAARQKEDSQSVLNHYKELIRLRTRSRWCDLIVYGDFEPYPTPGKPLICFQRVLGDKRLLVAVNYSDQKVSLDYDRKLSGLIHSNYSDATPFAYNKCELRPYEAAIFLPAARA